MPRKYRCSALPRIMACPASATKPKVRIDSDNVAGRIGSAVHKALAMAYLSGVPDLPAIAAEYRVTPEDITSLFWIGKNRLGEYADALDVHRIEHGLVRDVPGTDITLTGTADLFGLTKTEPPLPFVWDYKSGSQSTNHRDQLIGYAFLLYGEEYATVKIMTAWLRANEVQIDNITPADIAAWLERLQHAIKHPRTFRPGDHCGYCPRAHECKARTALIRKSAGDFLAIADKMKALTPETLAANYTRAKLLEKVLKQFDATLKDALVYHGELPMGDGRVLYLSESPRDKLITDKVIEHCALPIEKLLPAMSISKGGLTDAIKAECERENLPKGKTIKATMDALRDVGAIVTNTIKSISIRKGESNGK